MAETNKSQVSRTDESEGGDPIVSSAPMSFREIFDALDKAGVPDDFLSPSQRAQEPPQERDFGWDESERKADSVSAPRRRDEAEKG